MPVQVQVLSPALSSKGLAALAASPFFFRKPAEGIVINGRRHQAIPAKRRAERGRRTPSGAGVPKSSASDDRGGEATSRSRAGSGDSGLFSWIQPPSAGSMRHGRGRRRSETPVLLQRIIAMK